MGNLNMKSPNVFASAIFVLCLTFCFIFSIVCYTKFDGSDHMYIASIGKNWGTGPISEVEQGGFTCPTGKFSILNDDWTGTHNGCFCPSLGYDYLKAGRCSNKEHGRSQCLDVWSANPVQLKQWRSTNLCGKRGPNYLQMRTASSPNGCGGSYKNCGKIDTLENYLCYPENVPCPYNFMSIKSSKFQVPTDKNYTTVPLGQNGYEGKAIFSNEYTDAKVINEFRIDDNTPCLSPEYKNLNHTPYLLEKTYGYNKCTNAIGGQYIDTNFQKVDSTTYNQLYHDNKIISVIQQLPQFMTKYNYLESQTSLFYKNYIGMNKNCVEKMIKGKSSDEFIMSLVHIEEHINSAKACALIGMIICIIGFLVSIIGVISAKCCCDVESMYITCFFISSIIFFFIPALVCSAIIVGKINANNFDLTPLAQPGCTTPITQGALNGFSSGISSAKNMAAAYLSFSLIGIFAAVAVLLTK